MSYAKLIGKFLGILCGTFLGAQAVLAAPSATVEASPGLQAAKRAAFMENSGNLPARGLAIGTRAVQSAQKKKLPKTALKTLQR